MDQLIEYAIRYESFYKQTINDIFHTACSCVVGQQVAFTIGRNIRKTLYELYGFPLKRQTILDADLTQIINLSPKRIILLKEMAKIDDSRDVSTVLDDYSKLVGFGPWTLNAVKILMDIDDEVNLYSDSYIRKNLSLYVGIKLSEKECENYIFNAKQHQTKICYLLWRIKPTSVIKIKDKKTLENHDFV
jgi:3-methyladenine DNA glycosylase/8-oxoguanine DNA glycosylase